jgi:hypothetical protein
MSSEELVLARPPTESRSLELWIQHAAGKLIFEDIRGYAVKNIDQGLDAGARHAALKAIDDTVYGLMMVLDGVTGGLRNSQEYVSLKTEVQLRARASNSVLYSLDLADGDGMCMGYHRWIEGDYGEVAVTVGGDA